MRPPLLRALTALAFATSPALALDYGLYAGSEACRSCHPAQYGAWKATSHATGLQDPRTNPAALRGDFTAPGVGLKPEEVEFAVGGQKEQRYVKRVGNELYAVPKTWMLATKTWKSKDEFSWMKKPFGTYCKGCHVTGYDPAAGTTVETRVGCEACHGPAKKHAESGGKATVVNPSKLQADRKDMICAACHGVRGGRDPSGRYGFAVGFVPGEDLGAYFEPIAGEDDETPGQALVRLFGVWKKKRDQGGCDVCEISGSTEEKTPQYKILSFCFSCHDDLKPAYSRHTHHSPSIEVVCLDCHVAKPKPLSASAIPDLHPFGLAASHPEKCYDPEIEKACARCHRNRTQAWAAETVRGWKSSGEAQR